MFQLLLKIAKMFDFNLNCIGKKAKNLIAIFDKYLLIICKMILHLSEIYTRTENICYNSIASCYLEPLSDMFTLVLKLLSNLILLQINTTFYTR